MNAATIAIYAESNLGKKYKEFFSTPGATPKVFGRFQYALAYCRANSLDETLVQTWVPIWEGNATPTYIAI